LENRADAVSHSAHTHHRQGERKREELAFNHAPHTKFLTLPGGELEERRT
jgi:hypothetical protein